MKTTVNKEETPVKFWVKNIKANPIFQEQLKRGEFFDMKTITSEEQLLAAMEEYCHKGMNHTEVMDNIRDLFFSTVLRRHQEEVLVF